MSEKEKMLVTSIFSFSHNVFKELCTQGRYKLGVNPFPNDKFWTHPKLKDFADDNFKFDDFMKMSKFTKKVENTGGKREIARFEQFLLFP